MAFLVVAMSIDQPMLTSAVNKSSEWALYGSPAAYSTQTPTSHGKMKFLCQRIPSHGRLGTPGMSAEGFS